jgi:hypothetical protein
MWIYIIFAQDKIKTQASREGVLLTDTKQILRYDLIIGPIRRHYKCYNIQFQDIIKKINKNKSYL